MSGDYWLVMRLRRFSSLEIIGPALVPLRDPEDGSRFVLAFPTREQAMKEADGNAALVVQVRLCTTPHTPATGGEEG